MRLVAVITLPLQHGRVLCKQERVFLTSEIGILDFWEVWLCLASSNHGLGLYSLDPSDSRARLLEPRAVRGGVGKVVMIHDGFLTLAPSLSANLQTTSSD